MTNENNTDYTYDMRGGVQATKKHISTGIKLWAVAKSIEDAKALPCAAWIPSMQHSPIYQA